MTESDPRQELAEAFNRDLDPLAQFAETFEQQDIDPFEIYRQQRLSNKDIVDSTLGEYNRTFRKWKAHMEREGRHPACPNENHVKRFIKHLRDDQGNHNSTIQNRLMYLNQAYQYWQDDAAFPHPTDYNPIELAKNSTTFESSGPKEPPRLTVDDLRAKLNEITHIRDRAIVLLQLKLGLRASEVCNIKLSEMNLSATDVQQHYDEMGTARQVADRDDVVYIPHDRDRNKSRRPRVLPLDDEMRRALKRYLLIRPDAGEPWLFLSKTQQTKLRHKDVNKLWKEAFHPEYEESDQHRAVTSHYGRHRFTTYWRVEQDMNRELLKYMRGDTAGSAQLEDMGAIDEYIHTYYEDIEPIYRENIYKLTI